MKQAIYRHKTITLKQLLQEAENGSIAIPNIQRPFVWSPHQVAKYVDSLMHGWPCGSLLLWNTDASNQNIFATRSFTKLHTLQDATTANKVAATENNGYSHLILDGQQRMQSLVLAFSSGSQGIEATPKEWSRDMGSTKGSKKESERKLLCFNLKNWKPDIAETMPSFDYLAYEEDTLDDTPCLQWRTEEEIKASGNKLVPLCRIHEYNGNEYAGLEWLKERVDFILSDTQFPVLEVNKLDHKVESMDDDEAIVQIFTRLNTAGTPLTKEQIQAARINSLWSNFQDRIDTLKDILSKSPYGMTLSDDDIINGYNITLRAWYREENINDAYNRAKAADEWDNIWYLFAHYTRVCISALQEKKLSYNAEYKSLYILWFPVAHLCCKDGGKQTDERTEIPENLAHCLVKWVLVTTWARIWANRSGQYVKAYTKKLVNRGEEGTESWLSGILQEESLTKAASDSIDNLAASHRGSVRQYYLPLWAWTRFTRERAKFVLSFGDDTFAVDHIIPVAKIKDENVKAKYNSLGNCWMLNCDANSKKSDNDFVSFLKSYDITDVKDAATQLDSTEEYLKANKPADEYCNYIYNREKEIKNSIKNYITTPDMELHYPSKAEIQRRTYHHNTDGIYRGEEYTQSAKFLNLGFKSQQSYLSNIRGCLTELLLAETIQHKSPDELQQELDNANQVGNKASAWKRYLEFLLGIENHQNIQAPQGHNQPVVHQNDVIYLCNEFFESLAPLPDRTLQNYSSHVKGCMRRLGLDYASMQTKTPEELNEYLHEAPEMGNYATGWRHYLRFLLEQLNAEEQPIQRQPRRERENNVYLLNEYWQYAMYESEKPFETEDGFNSYLTGVKAAMRTYDLKIEELEDMNKEQIQNLIDRAGEKLNGNYPSHWRHYLRFLLTRI